MNCPHCRAPAVWVGGLKNTFRCSANCGGEVEDGISQETWELERQTLGAWSIVVRRKLYDGTPFKQRLTYEFVDQFNEDPARQRLRAELCVQAPRMARAILSGVVDPELLETLHAWIASAR